MFIVLLPALLWSQEPAGVPMAVPVEISESTSVTSPAAPDAPSAEATVAARLAELDARIAELEQHTSRTFGVGAYARGSTLLVDGGGQESVLERLRRVEHELSLAKTTIVQQRQQLEQGDQALTQAQADGRKQAQRADYLDHTREGLEMARATLAERQERISALEAQLAASELARLRSEREWYQLAADLLRLSPERPDGLPDIQSRVRDRTRDLRSASATPGGSPTAKGSAHPAAPTGTTGQHP